MKIGMLTSGGDCQGLNATIRGVGKTLLNICPEAEIYGIEDGYLGLIEGNWHRMKPEEFSGILTLGGTILGTSRQPYKTIQKKDEENELDKLSRMLKNYKKEKFDALVILGGNGTHKTANLLSENGVNVITLPKTIDNDLYGTDLTFGFDSAMEKATSVIDAIHTTAASHGRVFVIEIMGHKVGWLALYAGIAGGADVILLPEQPYDSKAVVKTVEERSKSGKRFSIVVVAEGAVSLEESNLPKKEQKALFADKTAGERVAAFLTQQLGQEVRATIPGHFQRGGSPTPTDRMWCSRLGSKAAQMLVEKEFGKMVAIRENSIVTVPLSEVAGKLKTVPMDGQEVQQARLLGITFGDNQTATTNLQKKKTKK